MNRGPTRSRGAPSHTALRPGLTDRKTVNGFRWLKRGARKQLGSSGGVEQLPPATPRLLEFGAAWGRSGPDQGPANFPLILKGTRCREGRLSRNSPCPQYPLPPPASYPPHPAPFFSPATFHNIHRCSRDNNFHLKKAKKVKTLYF